MPGKFRKNPNREIAIIGYGRFGSFIAHHLKRYFRIVVCDDHRTVKTERGIRCSTLPEILGKKIIILAVPIHALPSLLQRISPSVQPGTLIIDVCSVKEKPVHWMREILPENVSIVGSHPLFGPESAPRGIRGQSIVLCPVRISRRRLASVEIFLESLGLSVHRISPQRHDRIMAGTLFLTQLLGRGLRRYQLPEDDIVTPNFRKLSLIIQSSGRDSDELVRDMFQYNRFAKKIPGEIAGIFKKLSDDFAFV